MSNLAPAVGFCVKVIKLLSEQNEAIGISEISRQTEINKNMVSRILASLELEGWVKHDDDARYELTLLPFCLTSKAVNRYSLVNVGLPYVHKLWERYGESTYLGILRNDKVLYIVHLDSIQKVRVAGVVGESYPLYCTGPGKALLAFSDDEYIESYLDSNEFKAYTNKTHSDKESIKKELDIIRKRGYSLDDEEFGTGIICLAAPVFDYTNKVIGTVGCSFSTISCSIDTLYDYCGKDIIETARQISKCMGCEL